MAEDRHPDRRAISDRLLSTQKLGGPTRDYRWQVGAVRVWLGLSICLHRNYNHKEALTVIRADLNAPLLARLPPQQPSLSRHRAWGFLIHASILSPAKRIELVTNGIGGAAWKKQVSSRLHTNVHERGLNFQIRFR